MSAPNPLVCILESNRLTEINFKDWLKNLKIVLILKKIGYVLDQKPPAMPSHPSAEQKVAHEKWMDDDNRIRCYILAFMTNELQSQYEYMPTARAMITHL